MSRRVWEAALALARDTGEHIALGGGEPTLHPRFSEYLLEAVGQCEGVWLATNGSRTNISLGLAQLAKAGAIGCALSLDAYHAPIDERVESAFRAGRREDLWGRHGPDLREVRDVGGKLVNAGRCDWVETLDCACSELVVRPSGVIRGCGCKCAPVLGTVFNSRIPDDWERVECSRHQDVAVLQTLRKRRGPYDASVQSAG